MEGGGWEVRDGSKVGPKNLTLEKAANAAT